MTYKNARTKADLFTKAKTKEATLQKIEEEAGGAIGQRARANHLVRADLETIGNKLDLGVLDSSQQVYTPDLASVMEIIDAIVERYAMVTEIFCFPSLLAPSYLGFYLMECFLVYIKQYGQLSGTNAGLVPTNMDEWAIPLPFAQFLEGFGMYQEDGSTHRFSLDHSTPISVQSSFWGYSDGSNVLAARPFYPQGWQIGNMYPTKFDLVPTTNSVTITPVSEANFTSVVLAAVSESISAAGLAYVRGSDLRGVAPDGSAYAFINEDVNIITQCYYFLSPIDNYNAETALIYNKHNPLAKGLGFTAARAHSKRCVCCGTDDGDLVGPWYLQPGKLFVFIKSTAKSFRHVPLHRIKYCKVELTTMFPNTQTLDWRGYANLVHQHYAACLKSFPIDSSVSADPLAHYLATYEIVCFMAMWARFTRAIPYWRPYFNIPGFGFYTPQSFFASNAWQSFRLPVAIVECIEAVGPVVYRGRMYYPTFPTRQISSPNAVAAMTGAIWSMNNGWTDDDTGAAFNLALNYTTGSNIGALGLILGSLQTPNTNPPVVSQVKLGDYAVNPSFGYYPLFTINFHASAVYKYFDAFHNELSKSTSMNKSLVHQHYNKCGATYVMLFNMSGAFAPGYVTGRAYEQLISSDSLPKLAVPPAFDLSAFSFPSPQFSHGACLLQLGAEDLVLAWAFSLNQRQQNGLSPIPLNDGKFLVQLPASTSASSIVEQLIQATYMNGSTMVDAIVKREAEYKEILFEGVINGAMPPDRDHCFIKNLFKGALRILGAGLRLGISTAAGGVCAIGASMVGAEKYAESAADGCSAGANKAMDFIASRMGIDSSDITTSQTTAKVSAAAKVKAVKAVADQVRKISANPVK
jgi:hypothetical protein